jgi:hypothetical protein
MKRFLITSILAAIVAVGTALMAQDYPEEYLGLPGDNFNLYAVMKLFQESETIEGFERSLNDENTRINNLDLNNDNYIDYVKVVDYVDGDVHTIVLRALLNRNESQDVAVFTVQKFRDGSVQIQLIGDEALYGSNYIVEPIYAETPNPGYTGRATAQNVTVVRTTYVEVATWPLVRFIFLPNYVVWRSSWYWGYYPSYWRPWRPFYWHYYYGYHYHWYPTYYSHYHRWYSPRYTRWNDFYYSRNRVYSRNVTININSGRYKNTYSHPEMRREGETLYAKSHPERAASMSSTATILSRRSASQNASDRQGSVSSSGTTRRSSNTVNNNTRTNASQGQSSGTVRRSSATVNENSSVNRSSGQSTGTVRRSSTTTNQNRSVNSSSGQSTGTVRRATISTNQNRSVNTSSGQSNASVRRSSSNQNNAAVPRSNTTVNNRAQTNSAASQSTVTNRRSSGTVSSRSASSSQPSQKASTSRSTRQSATSTRASSRKSSSSSKSGSSSSKSSSSKESKSSTSRRK